MVGVTTTLNVYEEDPNGVSLFIENCRYRCPTENGLVCGGHGTCQMNSENTLAECLCDTSWFNPTCSCSDGSGEYPKTCEHGECNVYSSGCACHDDDLRGHWDGPFCSICQQDWFTEKTFCLQYCNPQTTCEGNANRCTVRDFVLSENAEDIYEPCEKTVNDNGEVELSGTCAVCDCLGNFDEQLSELPIITNQTEKFITSISVWYM